MIGRIEEHPPATHGPVDFASSGARRHRGLVRAVTTAWAFCAGLAACGEAATSAPAGAEARPVPEGARDVGYDLRVLKPRESEPLSATFERLAAQAQKESKHVVLLFSADWCNKCKKLDLELGNLHPAGAIGHVRLFKLVEEHWSEAMRTDEFEALRKRFSGSEAGTYPLMVALDDKLERREEMRDAIRRLEEAGRPPKLAEWFAALQS